MKIAGNNFLAVLFILLIVILGTPDRAVSQEMPETIKVNGHEPVPVEKFAWMLKSEKGMDVIEVIKSQSAFRPFTDSEIEIDPDGNYDFWFLFHVSGDSTPLYLTLPQIQNFEINLFRVDSNKAVLLSTGCVLRYFSFHKKGNRH